MHAHHAFPHREGHTSHVSVFPSIPSRRRCHERLDEPRSPVAVSRRAVPVLIALPHDARRRPHRRRRLSPDGSRARHSTPNHLPSARYFRAHDVRWFAKPFFNGVLEPSIARQVARGYAYLGDADSARLRASSPPLACPSGCDKVLCHAKWPEYWWDAGGEARPPMALEVGMRKWLRRIRGAIGMGLTWAAAWGGAGMITMLVFRLVTGSRPDAPVPLMFGAFGFVAGVIFSGVLGLAEGRRRFDQMSLRRFAAWGAAGGLLLAAAFVLAVSLSAGSGFLWNLVVVGPVFAAAAAGSAAGSLALARRTQRPQLLETTEDVTAVGLSRKG
jgi:hypothetical protein